MAVKPQPVPLTKQAYERLNQELRYLSTDRRRELAGELHAVRETESNNESDLGISVEYALEDKEMVERRIAGIESMLARAELIDEQAALASKTVCLGSVVEVVDSIGKVSTWQVVGPAESNPGAGKLSAESPVGAALIGRRAGDAVAVHTPSGIRSYSIRALRGEAPSPLHR